MLGVYLNLFCILFVHSSYFIIDVFIIVLKNKR